MMRIIFETKKDRPCCNRRVPPKTHTNVHKCTSMHIYAHKCTSTHKYTQIRTSNFVHISDLHFRIQSLIINLQLNNGCKLLGGVYLPKKDDLIEKLMRKSIPKNFTKRELDALMRYCGCEKDSGGRGSAISYYHKATGRILRFDGPHPGNELYPYQIKLVRTFLNEINEL